LRRLIFGALTALAAGDDFASLTYPFFIELMSVFLIENFEYYDLEPVFMHLPDVGVRQAYSF